MPDDSKGRPGLFKLKDLEALEIDEQPLFPASDDEDGGGLVSEVAAEEMAAAIRRARDLHSQEHDPDQLPPEVSGIYNLIMESPSAGPPALEEDVDVTGDHRAALDISELAKYVSGDGTASAAAESADGEPQEKGPTETAPETSESAGKAAPRGFRTAQSHAVIEAAQAERSKSSAGTRLLMIGLPLLLVAVTAGVVVMVLAGGEPVSDADFPIREAAVAGSQSELAAVELMVVPEPEPEPDPAELERQREEREREERRERRRRERREREIDRDDLF